MSRRLRREEEAKDFEWLSEKCNPRLELETILKHDTTTRG